MRGELAAERVLHVDDAAEHVVAVMGDAALAVGERVEVVAVGPLHADAAPHGVVDAEEATAWVAPIEDGGAVGASNGARASPLVS